MVKEITIDELELVLPLFDAYRVFYGQESDITSAEKFLKERFNNNENVIFVAFVEGKAAGFTQLYTTFSSVSMEPMYILNDLYVDPAFRNKGIGEALLNESKELCKSKNFKGVGLETALDNPAQKLYERLGWDKDESYLHYFWTNPK